MSSVDRSNNVASSTRNPSGSASAPSTAAAPAASDDVVTARVKTALATAPGLSQLPIEVATKDGTVTLSGKVTTAANRDHAKQVASNTAGVRDVVDQMTVSS